MQLTLLCMHWCIASFHLAKWLKITLTLCIRPFTHHIWSERDCLFIFIVNYSSRINYLITWSFNYFFRSVLVLVLYVFGTCEANTELYQGNLFSFASSCFSNFKLVFTETFILRMHIFINWYAEYALYLHFAFLT